MFRLILLLLLTGCATVTEATKADNTVVVQTKKPTPVLKAKYKVGQCLYLFDPETKRGNKKDMLRIEAIEGDFYRYVWYGIWTEWSTDSFTMKIDVVERITKKRDCP